MNHTFPFIPDYSGYSVLITGGAGFIGSHVCDFLADTKAPLVRILDNLSTGDKSNIELCLQNKNFEFTEGDITNPEDCINACKGIDIVIHLAALGSVPRSVADPLATHAANSTGFLNMLWAAKENKVRKFIYASSSSVYGDNLQSPKKEGNEGKPLSPYASTKQNNEAYAELFFQLYGLQTIGMRFFNIYGPRQNKNGPYAAFMPLVLAAALEGSTLSIYGDGTQSRDFTYVANAVWAVVCAVNAGAEAAGKAFNVGCGESSGLLDIVKIAEEITDKKISIEFKPERSGDVRNSLADLTASKLLLQYEPLYTIKEGFTSTFHTIQSLKQISNHLS